MASGDSEATADKERRHRIEFSGATGLVRWAAMRDVNDCAESGARDSSARSGMSIATRPRNISLKLRQERHGSLPNCAIVAVPLLTELGRLNVAGL